MLLPLLKINVGEKFEQFKRKTQEEFEELSKNVTKRQIDKTTNKRTLQNRNLKTLSKFATSFTKNKCWQKI